ncbi:MAG: glycoside hydrolase family 2 TIM barrel-domain containing protein [Candidatus Omnitrophica bacterium]|nr:glycoside hydrolase family 2 TIM barrel-domain containing protein [Candidatus Omnitrophota bacterium]MDD5236783.1 glycoside hydrolase family 2 TIM barrel-domain containing protein [Candidatus Omnitrophota bacterium]
MRKPGSLILSFIFVFCVLGFTPAAFSQDKPAAAELLQKGWDAHGKYDIENTFKYTQECIDLYKEEADREQAALTSMPQNKQEIEALQVLNEVATCYFIQGESYMRQEKFQDAIKVFQLIIDKYPYAQAWDPRGWFWVIAKASQDSIDKMQGKVKESPEGKKPLQLTPTKVVLFDPGKEDFVDYQKYGEFQNVGTKDYKYVIKDQAGLSKAVGEGVYPNTTAVRKDPELKKALKEGRLEYSEWDLLYSQDLEAAFLKWAISAQPAATRQYYIGWIFEKSGLIKQAIKAYYSLIVRYPYGYGKTYWNTPWYLAQAAIGRIHFLLRKYPELGYKLKGASVTIINGFDNDVSNDIVITNPGNFVRTNQKLNFWDNLKAWYVALDGRQIKKVVGRGKVQLVQFKNGDWQLRVEKKPHCIKGVTYTPTRVGESPDNKTLFNWMEQDVNKNGLVDAPYEAFVDANGNNIQDPDEPAMGDFQLMKEMGVNTIRVYHQPFKINKPLLLDLYKKYGIMIILGDFLGKYAIGSGASWYEGTDYTNPQQKKKMLESVIQMVTEFKDEPYVLFWLLGNENVYGVACNADKKPEAFFDFCSEVAREIKKIDKNHPVAIASGDTVALDKFAEYGKDVDIFGSNVYRGETGFGYFWQQVKDVTGKPAFITEYGCPAYAEGYSQEEAEDLQADYLKNNWLDIENNMAFGDGAGNSLGGVLFEWMDEWWKAYEPQRHDTKSLFAGPFPDGYMHEEWLGVVSQGEGTLSPFLRQLRESYFTYQELWQKNCK